MSESLQPSNLDEFIDLSEETEIGNSICPNNKSPTDDKTLKNSKHLEIVKEINHEENKGEIKDEYKFEEKAAEAIQWFNKANTIHKGEIKSLRRVNDKYEGEIKCGVSHGHGKYVLGDGLSYYEGEFEDGKYNGFGVLLENSGEIKGGVPHGHGKYVLGDGLSYYEGEFECGKYNGFGVLLENSGAQYVGGWYRSLRSNFGKQIYESRDIYEGNWSEGKYSGYGVYSYKNGEYYRGSWKNGFKDDYGIFKWEDGVVYEGTWWSSCKHEGVIYYQNGCRLEGVFSYSPPDYIWNQNSLIQMVIVQRNFWRYL